MKTVTLNVKKKARVYFQCETENGYPAKLRITPESENLEPGTHELIVEDESIRSKWGTNLIYAMKTKFDDKKVITFKHDRYNYWLVDQCRKLGGKWDADEKIWVFPSLVEDKVEELDDRYNADIVDIEITAKNVEGSYCKPLYFCGYEIARAFGRDSGAKTNENVSLISGHVGSSGSRKNWYTYISEGSKIRLKIAKKLLDDNKSQFEDEWDIKIINTNEEYSQ